MAKVVTLQLPASHPFAPAATYAAAAAPAPAPASSPGFWESASTGEKVVIAGAGVGTLALLWLAMKGGGRRRRR